MMREVLRAIESALRPLRRQISMLFARGTAERFDDTRPVARAQASFLDGETRDGLEYVHVYGLSTHPQPGAGPAVAAFVHGDRHQGLLLMVGDRRYRPMGQQPGEVTLHDDQVQVVSLKRDRIEIDTPVGKVVVTASGDVEITAGGQVSVNASGDVNLVAGGDVNLGGPGGAAVARVGDLVNVGAGSSAGQWPIVSGSSKVKAVA